MPKEIPTFIQVNEAIQELKFIITIKNIYPTLTRPVSVYGREVYMIRKAEKRKLSALQMKIMIHAGCMQLHHRLNGILEELNVKPIITFIQNCQMN
jgi:hypothetical protein